MTYEYNNTTQMDLAPCIERSLCLSTKHIPEGDVPILAYCANERLTSPSEHPITVPLSVHDHVQGFMIRVPSELADAQSYSDQDRGQKGNSVVFELGLSATFWSLLELAAANNCWWLHLDCDGPEVEGLTAFDW